MVTMQTMLWSLQITASLSKELVMKLFNTACAIAGFLFKTAFLQERWGFIHVEHVKPTHDLTREQLCPFAMEGTCRTGGDIGSSAGAACCCGDPSCAPSRKIYYAL